ncbi:SAM domain (Sterile alpha motif) [Variovorax sp. CF079]|uniref:adenylate/guanylate cyclase domain-containing protein n=1 Tax=Variovorax sp. CF079 TaxID=1882774 RepID=UPI00088068CA|nr:adenylate/guanylate cyclase domain-containing protein [Variovorax sp. CF079]SDD31775.1 SAM domain (Sterile alpha motif) [Variovorax sp. CF079]
MQTIVQWLAEIGMERYAPMFEAQRIELDVIAGLTDADLKEIGIAALGDRKRILLVIAQGIQEVPTSHITQAAASLPATAQVAERRQLTVMFCDLVGSTQLAGLLDPEDLRAVIGDYHAAVTAAVAAHNGYVAQLLGDGVLVYFGYPHANEDDAARAIHAALDAIAAVGRLAAGGQHALHTRIGIATGLVVVGQIGSGTPAAELSASGETPSLAARLQSQAAPDCIVIADRTRRLIGEEFELDSLGLLELKGFEAPVHAWQVLRERRTASRFEAIHTQQLSQLIGRDSELALLLERWNTACEGEGQIVLLSGEPGIGKSRITQALRERTAAGARETMVLQCSPSHSNSALYPLVRGLENAANLTPADPPAQRAASFERYLSDHGVSLVPDALGCLLRLMMLPDGGRPAPAGQTPQQQKSATLQAAIDVIDGVSRRAPLLVLVEDAHWIDPTTEEWIGLAVDGLRDARVLMLLTCRPQYVPSWGNPSTWLTMNRLSHRQSAALIETVTAGKSLPVELIDEIIRKTDGVPLFVEELTKTVLASALVEDTPAGYRLHGPLQTLAIPSTLQDSLMARLDRLAPAKEIAQVAAAIGRDFSHALLAQVLQMPAAQLDQALDELLRAELVFRRGTPADAGYAFKHALIRDTAYNSMVRSQRALRHAQIADALERSEPQTVAAHPELLAQHHQEAGHGSEAIRYWTAAGDLAQRRYASREAASHYNAAIALVSRLPAGPARSELELALQLKLGNALTVSEGYASSATYQSYARARELARELGRVEDYVSAWVGSAPTMNSVSNSEIIESIREIEPAQLASLQARLRVSVSIVLGSARYLRGEIGEAWAHLEEAKALDDSVQLTHEHPIAGADPAVMIRAISMRVRGMQGYLEQAEALAAQALQIAEARGHPPTIAMARQTWIRVLLAKGEPAQAASEAKQMLELSERFGIQTRVANALIFLGRTSVALGDVEAGILLLRKGYDLWRSAGGKQQGSQYGAQAADVLLRAGRSDEARRFIAQAQAAQGETDERFYETELLRLCGRFLEIDGDDTGAEAHYQNAIAIAEERGAKLFSLRAARDLAGFWQRQGKSTEARQMLQPLYGWFTEGFGFSDLRETKALLDSLQKGQTKLDR